MSGMHRYLVSLGTNMEPREERLRQALAWMEETAESCFFSTPYATAPLHASADNERNHYLNAVAVADTMLAPDEFNRLIKEYEASTGREHGPEAEGRVTIDIDIVADGDRIIRPKDFERYYFRQGYEELVSLGLTNFC